MRRARGRGPVLVVALWVLGLGLLAGCRTQPGAAAFVGEVRITDAQVEATVNRIDADLRAGARPEGLPAEAYGNIRRAVVQLQVFVEVAKRYAAEQRYDAPTPDYADWAGRVGLPQDDPFVRL